jgi:hypothetical protein
VKQHRLWGRPGRPTHEVFHGKPDGETTVWHNGGVAALSDRDVGFLLGILVGEGHFGGDGRQPQITLRMHTRHESLFMWLMDRLPESRLYGPYHHGGRSYFQWMVRGVVLRDQVAPLIASHQDLLDDVTRERFQSMCREYRITLPESPSA